MNRSVTASLIACSALIALGSLNAQERNPWSSSDAPNTTMRGAAVNTIEDGSFESGSPSSFWVEASTNFGTPLCTIAVCGDGGGTVGPRSGDWWAWFGGTPAPETGSVSQDVQISSNSTATLDFYYWNGTCADENDFLAVVVDDATVWSVNCSAIPVEGNGGYVPAEVDLSPYADGAVHTITFTSTTSGSGTTNFSLDDISLLVVPSVSVIEVPTLGIWGVGALALLLAGMAAYRLRV